MPNREQCAWAAGARRRRQGAPLGHAALPADNDNKGTSEQAMTRPLGPARSDFGVTNLRNSPLLRVIRALNSNRADTNCAAQTCSEVPKIIPGFV